MTSYLFFNFYFISECRGGFQHNLLLLKTGLPDQPAPEQAHDKGEEFKAIQLYLF